MKDNNSAGWLQNISFLIAAAGACALLATMLLVTVSVIGRHLSISVPGSIEIAEVLVLIVASAGIVYATVERGHAAAKLIIDRLSPTQQILLKHFGVLSGLVFCLALLIGNVWLLYDIWQTGERSHLIGIPIIPFRFVFCFSLLLTIVILMRQFKNNKNQQE